MKAFITTIIIPSEWDKEDILTSINTGLKNYAEKKGHDLSGIVHSVTISEELELKRQDL